MHKTNVRSVRSACVKSNYFELWFLLRIADAENSCAKDRNNNIFEH